MITTKKESSYGILAIVAIVAIIALFSLSSQKSVVTTTTTTESTAEEAENLAGQAIMKQVKVRSIKTANSCDLMNFIQENPGMGLGDLKNYIEEYCKDMDGSIRSDHTCDMNDDGISNVLDVVICVNDVLNSGFYAESGTIKCEHAGVDDTGFVDGVEYLAVNNGMIRDLDSYPGFDHTTICTSHVTNMEGLFQILDGMGSSFNQDISGWDTSSVENMHAMFNDAYLFNQDISNWDTSSVTNMRFMFATADAFNQDIGGWDTSSVESMSYMLAYTYAFNQDISSWNVNNVAFCSEFKQYSALTCPNTPVFDDTTCTGCSSLFYEESGTIKCEDADVGDIGVVNGVNYSAVNNAILSNMDTSNDDYVHICTSHVTDMSSLFYVVSTGINFNQNISGWDTSNVINMVQLFNDAYLFNQDISNWDTSKVTNMMGMFRSADDFNQDIGGWDTSNVINMVWMFSFTNNFNQDIGGWDTSRVTTMQEMFDHAKAFNKNIGGWNTSRVTTMQNMFGSTDDFNQPIGGWDTSSVEEMKWMFYSADDFNQDIGGWDTSSAINMQEMFKGSSTFDQNISSWNVGNMSACGDFRANSALTCPNTPVFGDTSCTGC